jgi:hypothetical protein
MQPLTPAAVMGMTNRWLWFILQQVDYGGTERADEVAS